MRIGPFYFNPQEQTHHKYDRLTGKVKKYIKQKTIVRRIERLSFFIQWHYSKDKIHELADNYDVELTYE